MSKFKFPKIPPPLKRPLILLVIGAGVATGVLNPAAAEALRQVLLALSGG